MSPAVLAVVLAACSSNTVTGGGNTTAPGVLHYDSLATQATDSGLSVRPQLLSLIVAAMSRGAVPKQALGRFNSNPQSYNIVGLRVVSSATPADSTQADSVDLFLAWVRYSAANILVTQVAYGVPGDTLPSQFQVIYLPDSGQDAPVFSDSGAWHETVVNPGGSCVFTTVVNNFYPTSAPCTPQTAAWSLSTQIVIPPNPDTLPTPVSFPSAAFANSVRIDLGSTAVPKPLSADGRVVGLTKFLGAVQPGAIRGGRGSR
jgi:hypothetical protein